MIELWDMSWREVFLRYRGIMQSQAPIRRAAYLIHRSLVPKPINILEEWPIAGDPVEEIDHRSTFERLKDRLEQYKQQHGNPKA